MAQGHPPPPPLLRPFFPRSPRSLPVRAGREAWPPESPVWGQVPRPRSEATRWPVSAATCIPGWRRRPRIDTHSGLWSELYSSPPAQGGSGQGTGGEGRGGSAPPRGCPVSSLLGPSQAPATFLWSRREGDSSLLARVSVKWVLGPGAPVAVLLARLWVPEAAEPCCVACW